VKWARSTAARGPKKTDGVRHLHLLLDKGVYEMSFCKTFRSLCVMAGWIVVCATMTLGENASAQNPQPKPQGNVLNPYGAPVGAVDEKGQVTTPYGSKLGSVDPGGRIYNVSGIYIGTVYPNGDIFNQAGDFLGYVDAEGNVFNVSDFRVGSVQAEGNVLLAGGAARIIFFKSSRGSGSKPRPVPQPR
jgi:hypothetical protein